MALAAAEAASQGATVSEIISLVKNSQTNTHLFAALSTLKYLVMGGRVSNIAGGVAAVLSLKPILTIRDGKLDLLERVRTQKKAWERVIELSARTAGNHQIEKMCILHVNALQMARQFEEEIRAGCSAPMKFYLQKSHLVYPSIQVLGWWGLSSL